MKFLSEKAGLAGHFTNYSLQATATTRLFEAGIDEQLIMLQTGHLTTAGKCHYKRVSEKMKSLTSDELNGAKRPKSEEIHVPLVKSEDAQYMEEDKGTTAMLKHGDSKVGTMLDAMHKKKDIAAVSLNFIGASPFTINLHF